MKTRRATNYKFPLQHDALMETAMHGILCACASPQYYARIEESAKRTRMTVPEMIASMARIQAYAMKGRK